MVSLLFTRPHKRRVCVRRAARGVEVMKQYIDEQLELGNEEPGEWLEFK
jgi:hypothetical protein